MKPQKGEFWIVEYRGEVTVARCDATDVERGDGTKTEIWSVLHDGLTASVATIVKHFRAVRKIDVGALLDQPAPHAGAATLADQIEQQARDPSAPAFPDIVEENWKIIVAALRRGTGRPMPIDTAQGFEALPGEDGEFAIGELRKAIDDIGISAFNAATWRIRKAIAVWRAQADQLRAKLAEGDLAVTSMSRLLLGAAREAGGAIRISRTTQEETNPAEWRLNVLVALDDGAVRIEAEKVKRGQS